jgi:RpiR family carbohydrate utilization transcriptional regulator
MANTVTARSISLLTPGIPGCILKLRGILPSLPAQHGRIAHFVMLNPAEFLESDSREIGYLCGTSEATVVRFCQRVGYHGLSEMKKVLARELAANLVSSRAADKAAREQSVFDQVFSDCAEAVQDTFAGVDRSKFDSVAEGIAWSERVYFFGAGGSAHIAQIAALNFLSLDFQAVAFVDPIQQLAAAKLITPRDLAIAVTYSGNQPDVAEALRIARKRRAFCVAITSFQQSLICKNADEFLMMSIPAEVLRGQTGPHRVAQIALLDALAICAGNLRSRRKMRSNSRARNFMGLPKVS